MRTPRLAAVAFLGLLLAVAASGAVSKRVPVVTQVQGVVFYRTFLMIGNASSSPSGLISMTLTYRSQVDGTLQSRALNLNDPIGAGEAQTLEDTIQAFKDAGAIRSQDLGAGIFGSLTVTASALSANSGLNLIARTYSPAPGGGTNGIAYVGRGTSSAGSHSRLITFVRNGAFGADGTTRANIGIVNEGATVTDVQLVYRDATTNALLKQFKLSDVAHHPLSPGEVYQLNNIFFDPLIPPGTRLMRVEILPLSTPNAVISGYAVQLDATTNDGSFFLMTEEGSSGGAAESAPAESPD